MNDNLLLLQLFPNAFPDFLNKRCGLVWAGSLLYATIDVDRGGVVGDPNHVFSQAGVVPPMIQTSPLNVKTAVLPHVHVLVCGHLKEREG